MAYKDPEYHKHYREKNKEILAERQRKYKQDNPERHTLLCKLNKKMFVLLVEVLFI